MNEAAVPVPLAPKEIKLSEKDIARFWSKVDKGGPTMPHMESPCWVWTVGEKKGEYGSFKIGGKAKKAHRIAWLISNGSIPHDGSFHGICVCHRCDRRDCVRVDHLFLGTQADNIRDMASKARSNPPRGDRNGSRLHPERRPRGDNHYARLHPERLARGNKSGARLHPERLARGDRNGSRLHPESRPRGEINSNAKLTAANVIDIRARYAAGGITLKELAVEFGVTFGLIGHIVNRRSWKHIP
jgi:hypothetical protein